jgi:hypothetical protein
MDIEEWPLARLPDTRRDIRSDGERPRRKPRPGPGASRMTRDRLRDKESARFASANREGTIATQTGSRTGNGSLARAGPRSGAAPIDWRGPAPAGPA